MDSQKVDLYIMSNAKYFESSQLLVIRERLSALEESKWILITSIELKDPTTSLIISVVAGYLGIDRFIIGDIGLGIGKLITCGGFGVWGIIDWFLIQDATRKKNFEKIQQFLY